MAGGHTPGSIAVELSSQDMMVSYLIASGILIGGMICKGRAIRPPFEDNPAKVGHELRRMIESGGKRFHMGYGGPLVSPDVLRHARNLAKLAGNPCTSGECNHHQH